MVSAKCDARVHLKKAKFHLVCDDDSKSHDGKRDKVFTSKRYTVVNLGCEKVKVIAAEGDRIDGCDKRLVLHGGKKATLQNYKNTWYVVA